RRATHEAHSLRETSNTETGYKACGKADAHHDSTINETTQIDGTTGPDVVSASQESNIMSQSHESTTPLIGNGRILQHCDPLYHQKLSDDESQHQQQLTAVSPSLGGGGGGGDSPYFQEGHGSPLEGVPQSHYGQQHQQQQQRVAYLPVYDYHSPTQVRSSHYPPASFL
ncbi:unnamed protein product, partial [Meganyctiphanes norvegica]